MTEEEKAKEYMLQNVEEREYGDGYFPEPLKSIEQAYIDGLTEGREEMKKEYKENAIPYVFELKDKVKDLEKENARLSKMLEMAINDTIRKGNQCFYCKDNYTKDICDNCTEEDRINVMKLYRAELEKRVESEK